MLATNVLHFTRILRRAGLPLGTRSTLDALACVEAASIEKRADLKAALRCVLVSRVEHLVLFDTAFDLFWRDPDIAAKMMAALLPEVSGRGTAAPPPPPPMRLMDAMHGQQSKQVAQTTQEPESLEFDAALTFSANEKFQRLDFESMNAEEWSQAKAAVREFALPVKPLRTRRMKSESCGRTIDLRRTLRESVRYGGELIQLQRKSPTIKPPPLVVLCDISGSMHRYTRMFLHFVHAMTNAANGAKTDQRVEVFLFGTRLTHITRQLRQKDVDVALNRVAGAAPDWSGGTRIGECLREFNQRWSRRVLGQGAVVLLLTDGLDRDDVAILSAGAERLSKSCRQLIWLNPLLRFDEFAPRAAGIKALMPHVSRFIPAHNLESIKSLAKTLSRG
jgi:uncharacterized protein